MPGVRASAGRHFSSEVDLDHVGLTSPDDEGLGTGLGYLPARDNGDGTHDAIRVCWAGICPPLSCIENRVDVQRVAHGTCTPLELGDQ